MDGRSPITGVTVVVFTSGLVLRTLNIPRDSTLQNTVIEALAPFTVYNLSVAVINAVGSGEIATEIAMTLSLSEYIHHTKNKCVDIIIKAGL